MKHITLAQGQLAIVDDEDYEALACYRWGYNHGYARRKLPRGSEGPRFLYMHRALLPVPEGLEVDHINRNKLDNQRANLRAVTRGTNIQNAGPSAVPKTSRFKGVSWDRASSKWAAEIKTRGRRIRLGYFTSETDAARAYDAAAAQHYGPHAWINFPQEHD